jgi:cobalamin biosynthesis protein CbiG
MIETAIAQICHSYQVPLEAIAGLATVATKATDLNLVELCGDRQWQLQTFPVEVLKKVVVPNPSEVVATKLGTMSVCEAAAILACQVLETSCLVVPKQVVKFEQPLDCETVAYVTVAIARES